MFNAETPQQTQSLISSVPGVQALEIETTVDQDSPNTNTPSAHPATDRYPALLELRASSPPPLREWFIEGFVPEDSLTILSGDGGLGKSYLALHMAQCIARGEPFLSREVKKARVLWVDAESLGEDELMRRSFQLAYGRGENETPQISITSVRKKGLGPIAYISNCYIT